MIVNFKITPQFIEKARSTAESILNCGNATKIRGRNKDQIIFDCLKGMALEQYFVNHCMLEVNPKKEDPFDRDSYEYDLYCPLTKKRYEVKTVKFFNSNYGRTAKYNQAIYDIAKSDRNFDYFAFGNLISLSHDFEAKAEIYGVISKKAIVEYTQKDNYQDGYYFFKSAIAKSRGANFEIYN